MQEVVKKNRQSQSMAGNVSWTDGNGGSRASENVDEDETKGEDQKYRKDEEERQISLLPANTTSIWVAHGMNSKLGLSFKDDAVREDGRSKSER
jgi:hypothetical protein